MRRISRQSVITGLVAAMLLVLFAAPAVAGGFEEFTMPVADAAICDFGDGEEVYTTYDPVTGDGSYTVMQLFKESIDPTRVLGIFKFDDVEYFRQDPDGGGPESFLATGTITATVNNDILRGIWSWTLTAPDGTRLGNSSGVIHQTTDEVLIRHTSRGVCSEP